MSAVVAIVGKDLRRGLRDRSVLLFGLVVPLVLAAILDAVLGGVTGSGSPLDGARFAVVDEDGGELATAFMSSVLPSATDGLGVVLVEYDDVEAAAAAVDDGAVEAAIVVPSGFSSAVEVSGPSRLRVVRSADAPIAGDVAEAVVAQFATRITGTQVAVVAALSAGVDAGRAGEIAQQAAEVVSPIQLVTGGVADRQLSSATYLSAGLLVFFLFFTVQYGVIGYLEERQDGTLPRLLAGPLTRAQVVMAKVLTSLVLGLASCATFIVASSLLLGADFGPWPALSLLVVAAVTCAVSFVAVAAAVARTPEQAGNLTSTVGILLGLLGGSFFPLTDGPGLLTTLSGLTPHGRFLRGLGDLQADGTVASVLPAAGYLLGLGLLLLGAGAVLARRDEAPT